MSTADATPWPLVYVVVLNWNQPHHTLDCLRSLQAVTYPCLRTVVVDNASTDDSVGQLRAAYPEVELLVNGENLGFAEGNNVGIRHALACGAEFVLLLNNDAVIHPDAVSELVRVAQERPAAGILGCKIYYYAEPKRVWELYNTLDWFRGRIRHRGQNADDRGQFEAIQTVDCVSGCALFIRRAVMERIGLIDTRYFLYFEDADWCVRATRAGFACLCVPSAQVWHKVSTSSRGANRSPNALLHYYYVRSQIVFLKRHAPTWAKVTCAPFVIARTLVMLARIVGSRLLGRRNVWRRVRAVLAGSYDGLTGRRREAHTI